MSRADHTGVRTPGCTFAGPWPGSGVSSRLMRSKTSETSWVAVTQECVKLSLAKACLGNWGSDLKDNQIGLKNGEVLSEMRDCSRLFSSSVCEYGSRNNRISLFLVILK